MERALCPVLIGREEELSDLEDALLAANRGVGQVVLLAGDAGMGKTRLATELTRRAERMGMTVLTGGCSEADLALPYLPFLEAIGNYLAGADLERVRAELGPVRRELAHLFPQLDPEGVPSDSMDPVQGRLRLFEAMLALMRLPAAEGGLVIVIEDLHWADASTRELLDYLTRRLRNSRILVVGTYRRDEMHRRHSLLPLIQGWRRSSAATIVELEPLTPIKVAQMVTAIFDLSEGVRDDTRDFLHARTEGNPFVLEEMLKAALDRGDIYRTEAGWDRKALAEIRLPETVRDTILLRLDRLTEEERELLRAAAVLGYAFDYPTLVEVSGMDAHTVQSAVETCVQQQLMVAVEGRSGRFRFRHALTREAIYDDMILPRRERFHSRAADVLGASPGVPSTEICHHLLEAGRMEEAVPLALDAAAAAERTHAYQEAAELYEKVYRQVRDEGQLAEIICRMGVAHGLAGNRAAGRDYLADGIRRLEALGRVREGAGFRLPYARFLWEMGAAGEANREYQAARQTLEEFGPSAALALAYVRLAGMHIFQFEPAAAVEMADRAIAVAADVGAEEPRIWALNYKGGGLTGTGAVDEGIRLLDQAWREGLDLGLMSAGATALYNAGVMRVPALRAVNDMPALLPETERLGDFPLRREYSLLLRRVVAWLTGRYGVSLSLLDEVVDPVTGASEVTQLRTRTWRLDDLVELGRLDEAAAIMATLPTDQAELQERFGQFIASMKLELALDRVAEASSRAAAMLEVAARMRGGPRWLIVDFCSMALNSPEGLARLKEVVEEMSGEEVQPVLDFERDRVIARLALADGDLELAEKAARSTLALLIPAGYWDWAQWSRLLLGEILLRKGDRKGGLGELSALASEADERGAVMARRRAEAVASRFNLGLDPARPPAAAGAEPDRREPTPATGERLVTVLFADVRGYTALSQEAAPADLVDRLGAFQRWATAEVERQHGIVDKFAGDALMATFNVSGGQVDHAGHAVRCAIALRDKAQALGLPIGCGLATGAAVVGALAPGANVSVVGQATNLAARLQAQAGPGEIILEAEAFRRSAPWLLEQGYRPEAAPYELKGFDAPVTGHRIAAAAD